MALGAALVAQSPTGAAGTPRGRFVYVCLGEEVTALGTRGDDRIEGTKGRDVILGLGGDDVILGGDGRDLLCGAAGNDRLQGRYGDDFLAGGTGDDQLDGGPGDDLLVGGAGSDGLVGGDGDDTDTLVGGADWDFMTGGDGRFDRDFLFGGAGNDYVDGGLGGNDSLYGGLGDDVLTGGIVSFEFSPAGVVVDLTAGGASRQASGEGIDHVSDAGGIVGSHHADVITDDDGPGWLRGRGGDDVIVAADGIDRVDGGPGSDRLDGGAGNDFLSFEDSPTGVTTSLRDGTASGAGSDSLIGFENLEGSFFDDHLTGDDAPNELLGSYGNNTIFGLAGNDTLWFGDAGDAGEGTDECWSTVLEGCEQFGHADPPSLPFVSDPLQGADLERIGTIRGGIAGGLGGPDEDSILVDVRRMTPNGCWWWNARRERFTRGPCGVPFGNDVPIGGSGAWVLRVDTALPAGAYQVTSSWHHANYRRFPCQGYFAPSCVSFDVR